MENSGAYAALPDDEKRTLLILLMEDIRGAFDLGAGIRTQTVIALARDLGYERVERHALAYAEDEDYRDGRHFRTDFTEGGYGDPPFPVTRTRGEASEALIRAVEDICDYPEYRLIDEEGGTVSDVPIDVLLDTSNEEPSDAVKEFYAAEGHPASAGTAHTRGTTDCGPDFCIECSALVEEWVRWPCQSLNWTPPVDTPEPRTAGGLQRPWREVGTPHSPDEAD